MVRLTLYSADFSDKARAVLGHAFLEFLWGLAKENGRLMSHCGLSDALAAFEYSFYQPKFSSVNKLPLGAWKNCTYVFPWLQLPLVVAAMRVFLHWWYYLLIVLSLTTSMISSSFLLLQCSVFECSSFVFRYTLQIRIFIFFFFSWSLTYFQLFPCKCA